MMKKILSMLLIFTLLLSCVRINTRASNDTFTHVVGGYQYSGTLPSGWFFYIKDSDGYARPYSASKVMLNVLNRMGVAVKTGSVSGLVASLISDLSSKSAVASGFIYDSNNLIVGVALDDLTGCELSTHAGTGGSFAVPSDVSNAIHDVASDALQNLQPDFINIGTFPENLAKPRFSDFYTNSGSYSNYKDSVMAYVNAPTHAYNFYASYDNQSDKLRADSYYGNGSRESFLSFNLGTIFVSNSSGGYADICNFYGLDSKHNVVSINTIMNDGWNYNGYSCDFNAYDSSYNQASCYKVTFEEYSNSYSDGLFNSSHGCYFTGGNNQVFSNQGWVTLYKSLRIVQDINDNTYEPDYLVSETFNQYNSSSSNVYNITYNTNNTQDIDNSETNNTSIYNESKTEINNSTTNNNNIYNIDNSTTIIDNHVENYYGDSGGSGGGGSDDDNTHWWDSIVDALGGFFAGLGAIVTSIISGILGLFTDVLNMIANIQVDITALTSWLGGIFDFLPAELVAILCTGVSLMVLICIIKALK